MNTPRAILLMLAGLACGAGVRLAFAIPDSTAKSPGTPPKNQPVPADSRPVAPDPAPNSRPAEAAMISAKGGARLRQLVAWLPEATETELRRVAEVFSATDSSVDYLCAQLLMARWAEVNPRTMLDWTRGLSRGHFDGSFYVNDAIEAWARVDFDSAWAAASSGQPGTRSAALRGLTVSDPDKALRFLRDDPSLLSLSGHVNMDEVLEPLALQKPAEVAALLDRASPEQRKDLADHFALTWARTDPAAAVAWMTSLEPGIRNQALQESGQWIAAHAQEHFPALLEKIAPGRLRSSLQAAGLAGLAATDLPAARRQLEAMPAGPAQQYGRAVLVREFVRRGDEAAAIELGNQIGWSVPQEWAPSYTESRYGDELGSGSMGSSSGERDHLLNAMQELIGRIAARDPAAAARLLDKSKGVGELISGRPEANPAALGEALLKTGDPGEVKRRHLGALAEAWMEQDPVAAVNWAAGHDLLLYTFLNRWEHDPSAMLQWAGTLPAARRTEVLKTTLTGWARNGVSNVPAAIQRSSLPEEEKQTLLSLFPPKP